VLLKDGPAVPYDLLSIDVGSAPNLETIPGARQWATPVKPIAELARHWMDFLGRMKTWLGPLDVTVIGGGAGGVELALAIDHRLREAAKGAQVQVTLLTKDEILTGQAAAARRRMRAIFRRRGLQLLEKAAIVRIERGAVQLESGKWRHADAVFVVTEASAAHWFAATGLPLDERGFLAVADTLRSTGDERVFAVGDCATVLKHPRPKAGVFCRTRRPSRSCRRPATSRSSAPATAAPWRRAVGGRSRAPGCGAGRTTSIASGCAFINAASDDVKRDFLYAVFGNLRTVKREITMAKNTIVDAVADAVISAEVAVVKAGQQAVKAVQSGVEAGARRIASKKKAAKKVVKKAAKKAKKAVSKTKRAVKKVAKKAAKRKHR
jgi:hypothetical protein